MFKGIGQDQPQDGELNNLTDEPALKTKTDVLDLIISFLMEHEKQMDHMLQRLEGIVETLSKSGRYIEQVSASQYPKESQPNSFTLTITSPDNFEGMKSLNIEWGTKHGSITHTDRMRGHVYKRDAPNWEESGGDTAPR